MADTKNTGEARKAYGIAQKALRQAHEEEFADLLDTAYESLGLQSPRVKREARAAEAAAKKQIAAEKREQRRVKKIAEAKALLASLEAEDTDPGDPVF